MLFFNDAVTPEIYPLSLHDALPISIEGAPLECPTMISSCKNPSGRAIALPGSWSLEQLLVLMDSYNRSEEHTSELQSRPHLVCRLLLEKKELQRHRRLHVEVVR